MDVRAMARFWGAPRGPRRRAAGSQRFPIDPQQMLSLSWLRLAILLPLGSVSPVWAFGEAL
eukprot:5542936-Pyramimonas_sp.AAC.1